MSVLQTVLVYAVIPLALILVVAALTVFRSSGRPPRYKPGKPWEYGALWYEPHPEPGAHGSGSAGEHTTGHDGAPLAGHGGYLPGGQSGDQLGSTRIGGGPLAGDVQPGALASALAIGERPHSELHESPSRTTPVGTDRIDHTADRGAPTSGQEPGLPRRTAAGGARGSW